jgi:glycosyltransferase involved in cell wall biosynthesis
MQPPLVDVLIPAYNAAGSIGRAIRSLQAQTLPDWRAVIVDDGSTDATAARVQAFGEARLCLVSNPRNEGRGQARRLGLSRCAAPYVALLDADDWCLPERLQRLVEVLEADREIAYAGTASVVMQVDGMVAGRRGPLTGEHLPAGWRWNPDRLFHPTLCLRREVFERTMYSPARYSEDFIMLLRLCRHFPGRALGEALYIYEEGASQTAGKYARKSAEVARVLWHETESVPARLAALVSIAAKASAFSAASLLGLQGRLLRERTQPLPAGEAERVLRLRAEYQARP